jgi:hypothetical protein
MSNPYLDGYKGQIPEEKPRPKVTKRKPKTRSRQKKKELARSKEITIRSANQERQIVYGRFHMGGVISMAQLIGTKAKRTFGSGNSQIRFVAKEQGDPGNHIQIELRKSGNNTPLSVTNTVNSDTSPPVKKITVKLKTNGSGTVTSTVNQVIAAINNDANASSLVSVDDGSGNGSGIVADADPTLLTGGTAPYLHLVFTVAGHKIAGITRVFLNDEEVLFGDPIDPRWAIEGPKSPSKYFKRRVFFAQTNGDDNQAAQADLVEQSDLFFPDDAKWTTEHRQRGCAVGYATLIWYELAFPDGLPEFTFETDGALCFDPRTGLTVWTDNAALLIAHHLTDTRYGFGIPYAEIDEAQLIVAANICDERVARAGGGDEARYTINGMFDSGSSPGEILEGMLAAMGGDLIWASGLYKIYPAYYRAPQKTLTENDLRGPIGIQVLTPRKDRFNRVRGQYINPANKYEASDFPPVVNALYLAEDGNEEIWEDLTFNFVTSSSQAQRLAKIELERIRQGIAINTRCNLEVGLNLQVCDTVKVTLEKYGWVEKVFEVIEWSQVRDSERGEEIELLLQETAEGIYAWNSGEETKVDVSPNSTLPSAFSVTNPYDIRLYSGTDELYKRGDGTIFTRLRVSWVMPSDLFVTSGGFYEIEYRRTYDNAWIRLPDVPGSQSFTYILDVQDGVYYDVRVRAKNALGYVNPEWITYLGHMVLGKQAPPSDVTTFTGEVGAYGILFRWNPIPDYDVKEYEVRLGASWETGVVQFVTSATNFLVPIRTAANYQFWIKAVDTSRNYSLNATPLLSTVRAPNAPETLFILEGPDILLKWTPPTVGEFAIKEYEIRYQQLTQLDESLINASYGESILLTTTRSTSHRRKVDWSGVRAFWVSARDVADNLGAPYRVDINIVPPGVVQSMQADVIDNNVLLKWQPPITGTLPIQSYRVFRGDVYPGATAVGDVGGTFIPLFEMVSGNFTYWILAEDTGGNKGPIRSLTARVSEPPDFVLKTDIVADPVQAITLTNIYIEGVGFG